MPISGWGARLAVVAGGIVAVGGLAHVAIAQASPVKQCIMQIDQEGTTPPAPVPPAKPPPPKPTSSNVFCQSLLCNNACKLLNTNTGAKGGPRYVCACNGVAEIGCDGEATGNVTPLPGPMGGTAGWNVSPATAVGCNPNPELCNPGLDCKEDNPDWSPHATNPAKSARSFRCVCG